VAVGRKGVQTKEKYKLRLTTKAYKLSYNYINYTINLVGRSFGRWIQYVAFFTVKERRLGVSRYVCIYSLPQVKAFYLDHCSMHLIQI
jgi:hypothetical protein